MLEDGLLLIEDDALILLDGLEEALLDIELLAEIELEGEVEGEELGELLAELDGELGDPKSFTEKLSIS